MKRGLLRTARAGFTLIEILAVILIIGILTGVLVSQLGGADDAAKSSLTKSYLKQLELTIKEYSNAKGGFPSSHFDADAGIDNGGTNIGAEALYVALFTDGWVDAIDAELVDNLGNTDGDSSSRVLVDGMGRELHEIVDAWENPIAYIDRLDYGIENREYVTYSPDTGEEIQSYVSARKMAGKDRYHKRTEFQLISAGQDGEFGTDDDITNFKED
jgi:prepilin-type N-terminal cleavage/methylation domain-containing protein